VRYASHVNSRRLLWLCIVVALACADPEPSVDLAGVREACLDAAAGRASRERYVLDLREAAPFDWDRFYVFPPRADMDAIETMLGFAWDPAATSGIAEREDVALLVFVRAGRVVSWLLHPREEADFAELVPPRGGFAPADARFALRWIDSVGAGAGADGRRAAARCLLLHLGGRD